MRISTGENWHHKLDLRKTIIFPLSGGNEKMSSYFSLGYYSEEGTVKRIQIRQIQLPLSFQLQTIFMVDYQTEHIRFDEKYG